MRTEQHIFVIDQYLGLSPESWCWVCWDDVTGSVERHGRDGVYSQVPREPDRGSPTDECRNAVVPNAGVPDPGICHLTLWVWLAVLFHLRTDCRHPGNTSADGKCVLRPAYYAYRMYLYRQHFGQQLCCSRQTSW